MTYRLHEYKDPLSEESLERFGIAGCLLATKGEDGTPHMVESMDEVQYFSSMGSASVAEYIGVVITWCLSSGYEHRKDDRITPDEYTNVSTRASVALAPAVSHPIAVFGAMHTGTSMLGDNIVLRHQIAHPDAPLEDAYNHTYTSFETKTELITDMADDLKDGWDSDAQIIEAAGGFIAAFTAAVWESDLEEQLLLMHGAVHAFSHPLFTVAVMLPLLGAAIDTSMEIKPWKYIGFGDTQVVPERVPVPDDLHLGSNIAVPMSLRIPHELASDDPRNN